MAPACGPSHPQLCAQARGGSPLPPPPSPPHNMAGPVLLRHAVGLIHPVGLVNSILLLLEVQVSCCAQAIELLRHLRFEGRHKGGKRQLGMRPGLWTQLCCTQGHRARLLPGAKSRRRCPRIAAPARDALAWPNTQDRPQRSTAAALKKAGPSAAPRLADHWGQPVAQRSAAAAGRNQSPLQPRP